MKVAYVAGPYRSSVGPDGILENIMAARRVAKELWQLGLAVICPHCNSFLMDGAAADEVWLEGGLEIMRRCDLVVVLPEWGDSTGTKAEIVQAAEWGVPVYFWPYDRELLVGVVSEPAGDVAAEGVGVV